VESKEESRMRVEVWYLKAAGAGFSSESRVVEFSWALMMKELPAISAACTLGPLGGLRR